MPTTAETTSFLYLILTSNGPPQINWPPICTQFGINASAANTRWYRVRQAMEAGRRVPLKECHAFLWAMVRNLKGGGRAGDKATPTIDWKPIAHKCNTTPGAAATRFYRMRKAWEKENGHAGSAPGSSRLPTPSKQKQKHKRAPKPSPKLENEYLSDATVFDPEEHMHDSLSGTLTTHTIKAEPDAVDEAASGKAFRGFGREGLEKRKAFKGFGVEGESVDFGDGVEEKDEGKKEWVERWLEEI